MTIKKVPKEILMLVEHHVGTGRDVGVEDIVAVMEVVDTTVPTVDLLVQMKNKVKKEA